MPVSFVSSCTASVANNKLQEATAVTREATADTKVDREVTEAATVVISEAVTASNRGCNFGTLVYKL